MTAPSTLVFPGNRTLAGWWRQFRDSHTEEWTKRAGARELLSLADSAQVNLGDKTDRGRCMALGHRLAGARDKVFVIRPEDSESGAAAAGGAEDGLGEIPVRMECCSMYNGNVQYRLKVESRLGE